MGKGGKIRVLQVVWRLALGGGVPYVVRSLLRNIDRDAFDVHVCVIRPLYEEDRIEEVGPGVTFHSLGLRGARTHALRARAAAGIGRVLRRVDPDVLHVHGGTAVYSAIGAALYGPTARLIEVHDAPQSGRLSPWNLRVERAMCRRLRFRPIVHSSAVRRGLEAAWNIRSDDAITFPLGVNVRAFQTALLDRASVRAGFGIPHDAFLVSYVARLVPEKRPELFVEVAARVAAERNDVYFALIGRGTSVEACRAAAERLRVADRVRIPGFVEDLPSLYHATDIFLSTSAYEGFGLAIAEAMTAGVPVVTTDVGGVADVVGDAGVLERSSDPGALARHVLRLIDDPAERTALGRRARERARQHLDEVRTARAFERAYREATESPWRFRRSNLGTGGSVVGDVRR